MIAVPIVVLIGVQAHRRRQRRQARTLSPSSRRLNEATALVTVSDPKSEEWDDGSSHVSYRVTSRLQRTRRVDESDGVRRRYSEFVWLYKRLLEERRGAILPVLDLSHVRRPDVRCHHLDEWLGDVVENPELIGASSLEAFLGSETSDGFASARARIDAECFGLGDFDDATTTPPAGGGENEPRKPRSPSKYAQARRFVSKQATKTAASAATRGGRTNLCENPREAEIRDVERYIEEFKGHAGKLYKPASDLVRSGREGADGWKRISELSDSWAASLRKRRSGRGDFADSDFSCSAADGAGAARADSTEPPRAADEARDRLRAIAGLAGAAAAESRRKADLEAEALDRSLREIALVAEAVKVALRKRNNVRLVCEARARRAAKLATARQCSEADRSGALRAADEAREELEQSTDRFLRETDRIDDALDRKLADALAEYGRVQLECAERTREIWLAMAAMDPSGAEADEGWTATTSGKQMLGKSSSQEFVGARNLAQDALTEPAATMSAMTAMGQLQ